MNSTVESRAPPGATDWALFATAIGACGIAWRGAAVAGLLLPAATRAATQAQMAARFGHDREKTPPAFVAGVIDAVARLTGGAAVDLDFVPLDMRGIGAFEQRVYAVTRGIAPGMTLTYGEVAMRLGQRGAARAVGRALGRNPFALIVPCHRVLAAGGRPGGFSAPGGALGKLRLLAIERAAPGGQPSLFRD